MKKEKKDKTVSRNITLEQYVHDYVVETGESPIEKRNFSNMAQKLILEAKEARDKRKGK